MSSLLTLQGLSNLNLERYRCDNAPFFSAPLERVSKSGGRGQNHLFIHSFIDVRAACENMTVSEALQDFVAKSGSIVYIMVQYLPPELTAGARGHYHHGKMTAPLSANCFRFLLPQCSWIPPRRSSSRCYWPSCPCSPLPPQYRTGGPVTWTDCPIRPNI